LGWDGSLTGFTNGKDMQKQITHFISSVFPLEKTICNSVGDYLKIFLKNIFYKTIKKLN
jgi:hypothetical protein